MPTQRAPDPSASATGFAALGVPAELVAALAAEGIVEPFAVQAATIPDTLAGDDVLGRAPTGSGKTLAFGIPLIAQLERSEPSQPRGLILSPTRELAEQIRRELEPLAFAVNRRVLAVYGGTSTYQHVKRLDRGVDLLVACPGRLLDLIGQRAVDLSKVDIVVVDEADRMADMGFLPDVCALLDETSPKRQTVLYSATLDNDVKVLIERYQRNPRRHTIAEVEPDLRLVQHRFIRLQHLQRIPMTAALIEEADGPTIVFTRTRHGADRVARQLGAHGVRAGSIHGGRSQPQRDRALAEFVAGDVQALVATDVAARGIHVDGVACVVHFDPPEDDKAYTHRSGRTARAGAKGEIVSLLQQKDVKPSQRMQSQLGLEIDLEDVDPAWVGGGRRDRGGNERRERGKSRSKKPSGRRDEGAGSRDKASQKAERRAERSAADTQRAHARWAASKARSSDSDEDGSQRGRGAKSTSGSSRPGKGRNQAAGTGGKAAGKRSTGTGGKAAGKRSTKAGGKAAGKPRQKNRARNAGAAKNVGKRRGTRKSR